MTHSGACGRKRTDPAGRGRPADPGIERRVLAAALTVYGEVGWAGFTLDRVARRAPVGKAALYRRWPSKEDLLLAALEHLAEPPGDEADPADLRGCLIGMTEQVIDMFVGPKALVLPRVLIEASQYPPRFDDMVQNIVRARFGTVRTVIQAAADRGELPARTPPDLIIDAIMGRVISLIVLTPGARRATINAERDRYAASITDFVLRAIAGLAEVVALRPPPSPHPGLDRFFHGATWLWAGIFAVSAAGLAAGVAIEPATVFLLLTTAVTIGGVVAGTILSALWFIRVLRRSGLRIRFSQV